MLEVQAAAALHTRRTHLHRLSLTDGARKHAAKSQEALLRGVGGARLAWQPVGSRLSRWAGHWGKRFGCCFDGRQAGLLSDDSPSILPPHNPHLPTWAAPQPGPPPFSTRTAPAVHPLPCRTAAPPPPLHQDWTQAQHRPPQQPPLSAAQAGAAAGGSSARAPQPAGRAGAQLPCLELPRTAAARRCGERRVAAKGDDQSGKKLEQCTFAA